MKWCNDGENIALTLLLTSTEADVLYLGIYKNSTEPGEDTAISSMTECSSPAWSEGLRQALGKGDWTITADTATNLQKTFTASGDIGNVYGYYITDVATGTTGNLLAVENFADGPYNVLTGGLVKITPRIIAS